MSDHDLQLASDQVTAVLHDIEAQMQQAPSQYLAMQAYALRAVLEMLEPFEDGSAEEDIDHWRMQILQASNSLGTAQGHARKFKEGLR